MDSSKLIRDNECDKNNFFKNIIYLGGFIHSIVISNFLRIYFSGSEVELDYKFKNKRCIEFEKPTVLL